MSNTSRGFVNLVNKYLPLGVNKKCKNDLYNRKVRKTKSG
jgi:hypothetical protein